MHIRENWKNTLSATAGVGISSFILLTSIGIANGLAGSTLKSVLSIAPHIKVSSGFGAIKNYQREINEIGQIENVKSSFPVISGKGIVKSKSPYGLLSEGVSIQGIREWDIPKLGLDGISKLEGAILGRELLKALNISVGDEIILISHENEEVKLRVSSSFETGFYDFDRNSIIIPFKLAERIFNTSAATHIEVKLVDPQRVRSVIEEIENRTSLSAVSWMDLNKQLLKGIALEKAVMIILLSFIVLISGFVVFTINNNKVRNHLREIGILRAIGFSKFQIGSSFLLAALFYSALGTIFGGVLTYIAKLILNNFTFSVINEVYYIPERIPFSLSISEIVKVLLGINGVVFLSSMPSAIKASSLDPIKALKYE